MEIRESRAEEEEEIWEIFRKVVATGDTYVFPPDSDRELFRKNWMAYFPLVAVSDEKVVGTYIIKKNQIGLGDHIANGSFMVHPDHQGKGIGKKMGLHSLDYARGKGFRAIQFNIVVATNDAAVALWKKIGFRIIGTAPGVFRHRDRGFVDGHIMFQEL